jgi:hypothetical protein
MASVLDVCSLSLCSAKSALIFPASTSHPSHCHSPLLSSPLTLTPTHSLILLPSAAYGILQGQRYFYFNVLEELDVAGEYYLDRANGMLYFWPPSAVGPNARTFVSVFGYDMINIQTATNITFTGTLLVFVIF